MLVTVTFEIDPKAKNFGQAKFPATSLHEALCQCIHEAGTERPSEPNAGSVKAQQWLLENVTDIELVTQS